MTKMPKKFMVSAIFFIICTPAIAAAFSGQVTVGSAEVHPGDYLALPVYLQDNDIDIMALTVPLSYDSPDLRVDSVTFAGTLIKPNMSALVQIDNDNQFVKFTYAPIAGLPLIQEGGGLLATIHFTVDAGALDHIVMVDSVYHLEYAGPPELWTRLEVADSSGSNLFFPEFSAGYVEVLTPTDVDDDGIGLPLVLELKQNYPNPFNPTTTLVFTLPERSFVSLKIYNILGQEAATLINEVMDPGEHKAVWDAGKNASGIYFYRLGYKNQLLTKKMTLLK